MPQGHGRAGRARIQKVTSSKGRNNQQHLEGCHAISRRFKPAIATSRQYMPSSKYGGATKLAFRRKYFQGSERLHTPVPERHLNARSVKRSRALTAMVK